MANPNENTGKDFESDIDDMYRGDHQEQEPRDDEE